VETERMSRVSEPRVLLFAIGGLLFAGQAAWSAEPIDDAAALFSDATGQRAAAAIQAIAQRYHIDLRVETFAQVPGERAAQYYEAKTAVGRGRFFTRWAHDQAAAERVDGIYVLICKDPLHVRVVTNPTAPGRPSSFSDRECSELQKRLDDAFRRQHYDAGLLEGIDFVRDQLEVDSRGSAWPCIGGIVLGAGALWTLLSLLNAKLRSSRPESEPVIVTQNVLLGGTLGAMGSYWMSPSLFAGSGWANRSTQV
jgi:hypothetical protein